MPQRPALLVVAHGSRDLRHAATVGALTERVRALRPELTVRTSFLEFDTPSVSSVLERLAAEGVREVVAQPLLLSRAYHARTDIPSVLRSAPTELRVRQADVLGPSPLLLDALDRRLAEAGLDETDRARTGVVLASAGSSDLRAQQAMGRLAQQWARSRGWFAARAAFASTALPRTEDAVRALREAGAARVAVAPYVLAPGRLPDRIAAGAAGADVLAEVLGNCPEVARVLLARYEAAAVPARTALGA